MKRKILLVVAGLVTASLALVHAQPPGYLQLGSVDVAPASPQLTAVDPMAWTISADVLPARPFLYSVDQTGLTVTRFNDNQVVGYWPWPTDVIYTVLPDGSFTGLTPPTEWEPTGMTVSYPTENELANRVKEIPDLTLPWTFVYGPAALHRHGQGLQHQARPHHELPQGNDHLRLQRRRGLECQQGSLGKADPAPDASGKAR